MRARDRTRVRVRVRVAFSSSGRRRGALACARSALADVLARVPLEQLCHKLLLVKAELDLLGWCHRHLLARSSWLAPRPRRRLPAQVTALAAYPPTRWLVTPPNTSQPAPPNTGLEKSSIGAPSSFLRDPLTKSLNSAHRRTRRTRPRGGRRGPEGPGPGLETPLFFLRK